MAESKWVKRSLPENPPSESYWDQAKRIGVSGGLQALQGVQNAFNIVPNIVNSALSQSSNPKYREAAQQAAKNLEDLNISKAIKQKFGLEEYTQPRNTGEEYIQRFAESAPLAALGGIGGLGITAAGTGAATALNKAGLPEWVQNAGQVGTEVGLGLASGKIPTIGSSQKIEYDLAKAAVNPSTKASGKLIRNALESVSTALEKEPSKHVGAIRRAINIVGKNMSAGVINPAEAIDIRKKLYKLSGELPTHVYNEYIKPITKGINNFFASYAAENPEFYKHLSSGDKLTELKHMKSIISDGISSLGLDKISGGKIASKILGKIAFGAGEKFIRGIATNSAARKHYFDVVSSILKNDPNLLIKNVAELSNSMPELDNIKETNKWVKRA